MLKGYLTYLTGFAAVILGVVSQIYGWFELDTNLQFIFLGFAAVGLRRATK